MTKSELKNILEQALIIPAAYSLDGGNPNESYVLSHEPNGQWAVYYSERGSRNDLRLFDSESSACEYFLNQVLRDPTTRTR